MQGNTGKYYLLFCEAKNNYNMEEMMQKLGSDPSDYNNIYKRIRDILECEDGVAVDSSRTRLQLVIEQKLTPKISDKIKESLLIFGVIRDAVERKIIRYDEKLKWIEAIKYSLLYQDHKKLKITLNFPEEYNLIANSISKLRGDGFKVQSIDGLIMQNDPEIFRLSEAIDYRVSKLGSDGFFHFNNEMAKNFSVDDMRFYLYRRRELVFSGQKPKLPFGYLFNLFSKYTGKKSKFKKRVLLTKFNDVKNLATHLATIIDVDKMSPYSNISVSHENIIEKLRDWVLYPEIFYVPQISSIHGKIIFPKLFYFIDDLPVNCRNEVNLVTSILQRIEDVLIRQKYISGQFTESELFHLCKDIVGRDEFLRVLSKISVSCALVNESYKTPFDACNANVKEIPLIKTNEAYVLANIATYNIAIYRTLLNITLSYDSNAEKKLGFALEAFIKERLGESGITFHHSFKYPVGNFIRDAIDTKRQEGECDFIVESNDYILLMEVKKKGLTKESWSGDIISLMIDTTFSFIKSINQLSIAELMLINKGKIVSKSGEEIFLEGRDVFKLVVSLEDMASLQCDGIKNSLLLGLCGVNINADDVNLVDIRKINKSLDEFAKIYSALSKEGEKYAKNPFHDISYISTPQLLTVLEDSFDNEGFVRNITHSNAVIYNLMDWYASYKASKNNKLIKDNNPILKRSSLIN